MTIERSERSWWLGKTKTEELEQDHTEPLLILDHHRNWTNIYLHVFTSDILTIDNEEHPDQQGRSANLAGSVGIKENYYPNKKSSPSINVVFERKDINKKETKKFINSIRGIDVAEVKSLIIGKKVEYKWIPESKALTQAREFVESLPSSKF